MMNSSFWAMGGYARYVWPCFGITGVVLLWNLWAARRSLNAARLKVARALAMAASEAQ
jgi:heme exporter protein CcmD